MSFLAKTYIVAAALLLGLPAAASAQTDATADATTQTQQPAVKALFVYPVAPDEIDGLKGKADWLVEHFWEPLNLKKKDPVDQTALTHAFQVWATSMQFAEPEKTFAAVDRLLESMKKNPTLMLQMTKAAEENLYGPNASFWIDDIYIRFLEALMKQKKLKDIHKARYARQLSQLKASQPGQVAPSFSFTKPDGSTGQYTPTGNYTIIEFGDPTCDDCSMAKLRMDTDIALGDLVKAGKVNICFFAPDPDDDWKKQLADYPSAWIVGKADGVEEIYDIRATPTFYIVGPDRTIRYKNIPVAEVIRIVKEEAK